MSNRMNELRQIARDYWEREKIRLARRDEANRQIAKIVGRLYGWRTVRKQYKSLPGQRGFCD